MRKNLLIIGYLRLPEHNITWIKRTGSVNLKQLASFIILLKSPLPSEDELETYKKAFAFRAGKDLVLDEEKFIQVINRDNQT